MQQYCSKVLSVIGVTRGSSCSGSTWSDSSSWLKGMAWWPFSSHVEVVVAAIVVIAVIVALTLIATIELLPLLLQLLLQLILLLISKQ